MIVSTTLDAEFEKSNGRKCHLRLRNADKSKTAEEIKSSLNKIAKLSLFEKEGVHQFHTLKHAKYIDKIETVIFDKRNQEKEQQPVSEPVLTEKETENTKLLESLTIEEERPEPGKLIQTVQLSEGFDPIKLTESQRMSVVLACLPEGYSLESAQIDTKVKPARYVFTERQKKEQSVEEPPQKKGRLRKRLLERIRKRE
ncbi:DUF2922 family protein [Enterococcus raffinosus]|uniref:DUF2922 family protein n=1 Tax=Enterococcus raffinosus TaxID=71452 RepID=UPI001C491B19|nr:DUF2922 family protein [Enterococcus raffinosus]QXJ58129.1 DUF2922 family protein [Enterococcus raffinosus]